MVSEAFARTTLRLALEAGYAREVRRRPSLLRKLGLSGEERLAIEALLDTPPATKEPASANGAD